MRKFYSILLIIISIAFNLYGKEFNDDFFKKHLAIKVFPIDSEASAVILFENVKYDIDLDPTTSNLPDVDNAVQHTMPGLGGSTVNLQPRQNTFKITQRVDYLQKQTVHRIVKIC